MKTAAKSANFLPSLCFLGNDDKTRTSAPTPRSLDDVFRHAVAIEISSGSPDKSPAWCPKYPAIAACTPLGRVKRVKLTICSGG